jgi:hypothetical protein
MGEHLYCPEIEVVEQYARGELQEQPSAEFRSHLEVCGLCSVIVERLREFGATPPAIPATAEPDWLPIQHRLAQECAQASPVKPARQVRWYTADFWIPALGYALALVLVYPAWLGVSRPPRKEGAPPPNVEDHTMEASGAVLVDLNTTRDAQDLPAVKARAGERAALTFFVPAKAGKPLSVAIVGGANNLVLDLGEIRSSDDHGNYCLVLYPRSLPPGRYRLIARDKQRPADPGNSFEFVRQ